jgi:hypothetical protein
MKRVPLVTNFNFLPDMGGMTARLRSGAATGLSPAQTRGPSRRSRLFAGRDLQAQ